LKQFQDGQYSGRWEIHDGLPLGKMFGLIRANYSRFLC